MKNNLYIVITDQAMKNSWLAPTVYIKSKEELENKELGVTIVEAKIIQIYINPFEVWNIRGSDSKQLWDLRRSLHKICTRRPYDFKAVYLLLSGQFIRQINYKNARTKDRFRDNMQVLQRTILEYLSEEDMCKWCGFLHPKVFRDFEHHSNPVVGKWMLKATTDPRITVQDFAWDIEANHLSKNGEVNELYKRVVIDRILKDICPWGRIKQIQPCFMHFN